MRSFALVIVVFGFGSSLPGYQTQKSPETPSVLEAKAPTYPRQALFVHAMGTVKVDVQIDRGGKVASARVASGHPLLGSPAREAALEWRFEPSATGESNRTATLTFDFLAEPEVCGELHSAVSPYHLQIYPPQQLSQGPTIENDVPPQLVGTLCKIHRAPLQKDTVRIQYGLMSFKPGYWKAEEKLFPNDNSVAYGGCVLETQIDICTGKEIQLSPKYADVLFCSACRLAALKWSKSHPWRL
ncbi:MAG: energy transducer TonB [Acidobacteriota bacterium]|nr:energy transducer TonB [Acidobacteriota bacterium]